MSFLTGAQTNTTSIGSSNQSIVFNPILNARGASSGPVTNAGIAPTNVNTIRNTLSGGPDQALEESGTVGLIPSLGLASDRGAPPANNYLSPRSFSSDSLPSGALPGDAAGAAPAMLPPMLVPLVVVAVVGLLIVLGR